MVVRLVWSFMVVGILYRGNSKTRIRRHELDGWTWVVFLACFSERAGRLRLVAFGMEKGLQVALGYTGRNNYRLAVRFI